MIFATGDRHVNGVFIHTHDVVSGKRLLFVFELNAHDQILKHLVARRMLAGHAISLGYMPLGVRQTMQQSAVVSKNQKSRGVRV